MEEMELTFVGFDDWSRAVYTSKDKQYFKDTNIFEGGVACICTADHFFGEPNMPIEYTEHKDKKVTLLPKRMIL